MDARDSTVDKPMIRALFIVACIRYNIHLYFTMYKEIMCSHPRLKLYSSLFTLFYYSFIDVYMLTYTRVTKSGEDFFFFVILFNLKSQGGWLSCYAYVRTYSQKHYKRNFRSNPVKKLVKNGYSTQATVFRPIFFRNFSFYYTGIALFTIYTI